MALTITIYYKGVNGNARKFADEMLSSGTVDAIRKEEGNSGYEYFQSLSYPETIMLVDSWKDDDALNAHHRSPMMTAIAELREKYDLHMIVSKYEKVEDGIDDDRYIRK